MDELAAIQAEKARRQELAAIQAERTRRESQAEPGGNWKQSLAKGARNVAAGVADIADLPALPFEAARYGSQYLANKVAPDTYEEAEFGKWLPKLGEKVANTIDKKTKGYTKPRSSSDRLAQGLTRALTGFPAGTGTASVLKGAPKVAKALKHIYAPTLGNIGATTGGVAAGHHYTENESNPSGLGLIGSSIAGSLAGGYGPSLARSLVKGITKPKDTFAGVVGKKMKFNPELYEKGKELGLAPSLGLASTSKFPTQIELLLGKHPATGDIMDRMLNQRREQLASHLGVSEAPNQDYHLARKGAQAFKEKQGQRYRAANENFKGLEDKFLKEHRNIDPSDILEAIDKDYKLGRQTPSEKATFGKSFPGKVEKALKTNLGEGHPDLNAFKASALKQGISEDMITRAMEKEFGTKQAGISYVTLKDLKKEAQDLVETLDPKTAEYAQAVAMNKLLKNKMVSHLQEHGTPEQVQSYNQANELWSDYASKKRSNLKHYVYDLTETDSDFGAFNKLFTNPKYIKAASTTLTPHEKSQLFESMMGKIGRRDDRFNIAAAQTALGSKNFNPYVKTEMLHLLPNETARENFLKALHYIGENKTKIESIANTSNTAHTASVLERYKDFVRGIGGLSGAALLGTGAVAPLTLLSGLVTQDLLARGTARMWTDPAFLSRINRVIQAKNAKSVMTGMDYLLKTPSVKQLLVANRPQLRDTE
jgi:hypothetical protein